MNLTTRSKQNSKTVPGLPTLIPGTGTMMRSHTHDYVMLHVKWDFSNVIKITKQLTSS